MRSMSVVLVVLSSGCFAVRGSGVADEEIRDPGSFDAVLNTMNIQVNVIDGDAAEVRVFCDDNLLDLVETEVSGGELRVTTPPNTSIHPNADCGVDLTMPSVTRLETSGSGSIVADGTFPDLRDVASSGSGRLRVQGAVDGLRTADSSGSGGLSVAGLSTSELAAECSGSGNIELSGDGGFADLRSTGSGGIDAGSLSVDEADIRNSGSGSVSLTVTEFASVRLSGSGNVRILGGARLDTNDSGSGNVVRD
jgi:hypothetical protein